MKVPMSTAKMENTLMRLVKLVGRGMSKTTPSEEITCTKWLVGRCGHL